MAEETRSAIRALGVLALALAGPLATAQAQSFHTEPAPEWDALFDRDSGWTGADGIYSIPLDGNDGLAAAGPASRTLFLFSDTAIGEVAPNDRRLPGTTLVNNTLAIFALGLGIISLLLLSQTAQNSAEFGRLQGSIKHQTPPV